MPLKDPEKTVEEEIKYSPWIDLNQPCWPWYGHISTGGYGKLRKNKKTFIAHRFLFETLKKPIPEGLEIDHVCRNRACVNPAHLEPVTRHENVRRGISPAANNLRKKACIHGHPFDEKNTIRRRNGNRYCKTCSNEWNAGKRERYGLPPKRPPASVARRAHVNPNTVKTHCKYGHPFTEENCYIYPNGNRQCLTCKRRYLREAQRKQKSLTPDLFRPQRIKEVPGLQKAAIQKEFE